MSSLVKFDYKELKQLANDKQSCIVEKTVTQNLSLEPWSLGNLKESIKNLLDYEIGKFIKALNGILVSFKNVRILQNVGAIKNDNSDVIFQVQADYFIFQPYVGATLKGIVIKKSITHLVVQLYRVFNVVIPRPTDEHGKTWIGLQIQENQEVSFKVVVLDLYGALPYIRGELDERLIKLGKGDDNEVEEPSHAKNIDVPYQQQNSERPMPSAKFFSGFNKLSTKNNATNDNNLIYQKQTVGDVQDNVPAIKSKNKRHKDYSQKFCNSDIKRIDIKRSDQRRVL